MIHKVKRYAGAVLREQRFLTNVTGQRAQAPKVLLSYTVLPFFSRKQTHTNSQESHCIAGILHRLGYQVDVIHYTSGRRLDYQRYALLFGFGEPFEKSFRDERCRAKRLYYATGAHVMHQNPAEARRVLAFNEQYGAVLLPKRLVPWCWTLSTTFSDAVVVIGNAWTASTYRQHTSRPVVPINATALFNPSSASIRRDAASARKHFLWFGSAGLVHKGLDLCVEAFAQRPDLTLHICGPKEADFFAAMRSLLDRPNIHYHGFVDVASQRFIDIVQQCQFAVLPSCSEGQATALLTVMGAGLIPVASRYTGVDVETFGVFIEELTAESVAMAVHQAEQLTEETLRTMSQTCAQSVARHHTLEAFEAAMTAALTPFLKAAG